MSTNHHHARHPSSFAASAPRTEGLHEDPRSVTCRFWREGWSAPFAEAPCRITPERLPTTQGDVIWELLRTPRLQLSRPACLFLLQGASLAQLLGDRAWIQQLDGPLVEGRLQLLGWKLDPLWAGRNFLDDVRLAHVLELPASLTLEGVTPQLLERARFL